MLQIEEEEEGEGEKKSVGWYCYLVKQGKTKIIQTVGSGVFISCCALLLIYTNSLCVCCCAVQGFTATQLPKWAMKETVLEGQVLVHPPTWAELPAGPCWG